MKAKILRDYAKAIEDIDYIEESKKDLKIEKTRIEIYKESIVIIFKNDYSSDLHIINSSLNISSEEKTKLATIIFTFIENKLNNNLKEAKAEYQKMLIEKL